MFMIMIMFPSLKFDSEFNWKENLYFFHFCEQNTIFCLFTFLTLINFKVVAYCHHFKIYQGHSDVFENIEINRG